jgi:hypothetical protein
MSVVLGVFSDGDNAENAILKLEDRGYNPKDMSILMKDTKTARDISENTGADVAEGAVKGAGTGAVVGGLAGFLAGTVVPGLGGFLIGGPVGAALGLTGAAATTVSGAVTGAVAGGLIGALMSTFGLSEEEAKDYETRINEGGILVAVPAKSGDEIEVKNIMRNFDADALRVVDSEDSRRTTLASRSRDMDRDDPSHHAMGAKGGRSNRDEEWDF